MSISDILHDYWSIQSHILQVYLFKESVYCQNLKCSQAQEAKRTQLIVAYISEYVREKIDKDIPITIIYNDRPNADFNSLFLGLAGLCIRI